MPTVGKCPRRDIDDLSRDYDETGLRGYCDFGEYDLQVNSDLSQDGAQDPRIPCAYSVDFDQCDGYPLFI